MKRLRELCERNGIAGREDAVRAYILEQLKTSDVPMTVQIDPLGNVIVKLKGKKTAPCHVAFAAHMDEVGGIVTGVDDNGFAAMATVGGVSDAVLFGRRVTVNGHPGVIGGKAVHQCSADEKNKLPNADKRRIDLGTDSREETLALIRCGDSVYFDEPWQVLSDGRIAAKALDDRVGCYLLLKLAQTQPLYDITLIFTVQEEVGLRGARVAANTVQPDYAVIVDATTAADTAGVAPLKEVCRQGRGAVVSFMDNATVYDKALFDFILTEAAENGLSVQVKEAVAGGNDAGAFQTAGKGVRVAAVSLPCRYIHSPSCVLNTADIEATEAVLRHLAARLPEGVV